VIVVDTNVISELMRGAPCPAVLGWVARQPRALHYTTYVNQAEILYGISALPEGRRRTALAAAAEATFAEDFAGRILSFEARAAARYPEIVLARCKAGNPIEKFDAVIAATALAAGASIATRDSGGFAGCGLTVIDPWMAS
jgi:predicted nucleic acid-binding protein